MSAHTPGPWSQYEGDPLIIIDSDGASLGEMSAGSPNVSRSEQIANARLIAAAPELLEALILLEHEMVESGNARSIDYGWKPAIEKTRAAIAKATGAKP